MFYFLLVLRDSFLSLLSPFIKSNEAWNNDIKESAGNNFGAKREVSDINSYFYHSHSWNLSFHPSPALRVSLCYATSKKRNHLNQRNKKQTKKFISEESPYLPLCCVIDMLSAFILVARAVCCIFADNTSKIANVFQHADFSSFFLHGMWNCLRFFSILRNRISREFLKDFFSWQHVFLVLRYIKILGKKL